MGIRKRLFSTFFTLGLGAVAGLFMAKKPGNELQGELREKAERVRKDLAKKLTAVSDISKTAYEEVLAEVVSYYEKAGELTKTEAEVLKTELAGRWEEVVEALRKSENNKGVSQGQAHSKRSKRHHR